MALTLGLVQCENVYSGQAWLPLAIGSLHAALLQHLPDPSRLRFLGPFWQRSDPHHTAHALLSADAVLFSIYAWNERWSLEVARHLKGLKPEILIVLGGPQVPSEAEGFLNRHRQVDLTCCGEGEQVVVHLLDVLLDSGTAPEQLKVRLTRKEVPVPPGLRWLDAAGGYQSTPPPPRTADLSRLASPFLSGCFDALLDAHPDSAWRMLLETNRGCPYACTFCDWGAYTASKLYTFPLERVKAELAWAGAHRLESIFVVDANYGILPRDLELIACMRDVRDRTGFPKTVAVQNAKVGAERIFAVWKALLDAGLNREAALPVQTTDPGTLETIRRINLPLTEQKMLSQRLFREDILTYSDVILGLPNEDLQTFRRSIGALIAHGQHHRLQISTLVLLPNAELGGAAAQAQYGLETVESRIATTWSMQRPPDPLAERQALVVGTAAMPRAEWVEARAFGWAAVLLHSHKLLQVPNVLLNVLEGVPYEDLISGLIEADPEQFPLFGRLGQSLRAAAQGVQRGEPEYVCDETLGGVWLPPDDLHLTRLHVEGQLPQLYTEACGWYCQAIQRWGLGVDQEVIEDACRLNLLWIRGCLENGETHVRLRYNLWDVMLGELRGIPIPLQRTPVTYTSVGAAHVYHRITPTHPPPG